MHLCGLFNMQVGEVEGEKETEKEGPARWEETRQWAVVVCKGCRKWNSQIPLSPPRAINNILSHILWSEVKVLVLQLCPTFCNPMDCNPPGSSVHGIFQARILEWVAIPFFSGSSQTKDQTQVSSLQADSLPPEPPGKSLSCEFSCKYWNLHQEEDFNCMMIRQT